MRKVGSENQADPILPWRLYAFSIVAFALSLFSKPVFCGVPVIIALLLWMARRWRWKDALLLCPHAAAAVVMSVVCRYFEIEHAGAKGTEFALTFSERITVAGLDVCFYVGKFLFPYPLYQGYPKWQTVGAPGWELTLFPLVLIMVGGLWALRDRIGRGPAAGFAIALVALAPALGFVSFFPMAWSYVEDHYAYFALPAFAALLVEAACRLMPQRLAMPRMPALIAGGLIAVLGGLTVFQSSLYRSGASLWNYSLWHYPDCWIAEINLANALLQESRPFEALPHARRAVAMVPANATAREQLVSALDLTGNPREALREIDILITMLPGNLDLVPWRGGLADRAATRPGPASSQPHPSAPK